MNDQPSIFRKLFDRVFPKMADFFGALSSQCQHVAQTAGLLVEFMETGDVVIGDGDVSRLFHLQTNIRYGCVILRHYLDRERGDLFLALGRYNGSRGKAEYPNLVFGARRAWDMPQA